MWIFLTSLGVNLGMLLEQFDVLPRMTLSRCHEPDGAVTMLAVVPAHQCLNPAACLRQILKRFNWHVGAVLQGPEQGL